MVQLYSWCAVSWGSIRLSDSVGIIKGMNKSIIQITLNNMLKVMLYVHSPAHPRRDSTYHNFLYTGLGLVLKPVGAL